MHELAVTTQIVDQVTDRLRVAAPPGARVAALHLEIGRLSGVMVDPVRFCFDAVAAGTTLAGARLDVDEEPGHATCHGCGREFDVPDLLAVCACGCDDLTITGGRRLRVVDVELATTAPTGPGQGERATEVTR